MRSSAWPDYHRRDVRDWAEWAGRNRYRVKATGLYGLRLQKDEEMKSPCVA